VTPRVAGILIAVLLSAGCGRSNVSAVVSYPAAMPLRVYPVVLVAFGADPADVDVASRVERHLRSQVGSSPAVDARLMPRETVDQLIAMRALEPGTAVVDVSSRSSMRLQTVPRSFTYQDCSFGRCITRTRTDYVEEAVASLTVTMAVRDIRTGRVIHSLQEVAELPRLGGGLSVALVDRVVSQLLPYLDQRTERVRVPLWDVPDPRVEAALDHLRAGEWRAGRVLLEEAVRSPELHAMDAEVRARALYALSVARRFDPTTLHDIARHYAAARAPLDAAIELDPQRVAYRDARGALDQDEARAQVLAAQEAVARDNAATLAPDPAAATAGTTPASLSPAADAIAPPPPAYR
jgi:hypothetical protein